jgi:hypothetical protein
MIWSFVWLLMLFCSVIVLPVWLWRRMKTVQQATRDKLDDTPAVRHSDRWEEIDVDESGRGAGRAENYSADLTAADRDRPQSADDAIFGDRR